MINFHHESLLKHDPDESFRFDRIVHTKINIQTEWSPSWSIFFTNPYPTNIQTCRSGTIQLLTQMQRDWFSSQTSTRRICKQIVQVWSSSWRKSTCSEKMCSSEEMLSVDRFSSQTPTWAISIPIVQVWSSYWRKSMCSEKTCSQVVDFVHESLPEPDPDK